MLVGAVTVAAFIARLSLADDKPIPKEVRDLVGTYTGEWTLYRFDVAKGETAKMNSWTDTVTAENPAIEGDRAFVTLTDEFRFPDGNSFKVTGKEGYTIKKDGSLGDNFIEMFGSLRVLVKISNEVSSYVTTADPQELGRLGLPKGATGQHVTVVAKTPEAGVETHRISRITHATWKDADGKEHWQHFLSLQGYHKKQK
jgi:hypothetical protein